MLAIISRNILNLLIFLFIILAATGCYSNRYFGTPDYFTKQPGVLVLKNGERINGEISVNNLLGNTVIIQSKTQKQSYKVDEVKACLLNIGVFQPMIIGREILQMRSQPVFMERLTPDSFSIQLYEAYQRQTNPNVMGDVTLQGGVEYDLAYFVHLPYDDPMVVWELSTTVVADHLSKGLDSLFGKCPQLMKKIRSGDPNYNIFFFPQIQVSEHVVLGRLTTSAKKEKVQQIIRVLEEYEKCKK